MDKETLYKILKTDNGIIAVQYDHEECKENKQNSGIYPTPPHEVDYFESVIGQLVNCELKAKHTSFSCSNVICSCSHDIEKAFCVFSVQRYKIYAHKTQTNG